MTVHRRLLTLLLDTVLPPVCSGCGLGGAWLCPRCAETVQGIDGDCACQRCGRPLGIGPQTCERCDAWGDAIDHARSAFQYEGAIRTMIHLMKYDGQRARAEWCGGALATIVCLHDSPIDVLVPVPLHRAKERARGFNQSWLIARHLATHVEIEAVDALVRIRETRSQVQLDAGQRRENVRGAFVARRQLRGMRVLLVDDVLTTGSTLVECALACRKAGAESVCAVTVATA